MIIKQEDLLDYQKISLPPKDSRIILFITREEKEALKRFSLNTGISMNEIMRRSLFNTLIY